MPASTSYVSVGRVVLGRVTENPTSYLIAGAALCLIKMRERSRVALEAFVQRHATGA
jgi:hypothetical protein